MTTKAKIDLVNNVVELEGSEQFVTKYLDEFRQLLRDRPIAYAPNEHSPPSQSGKKKTKKEKTIPAKKTKGPKKVEIEEFDIEGDTASSIPSLREFYKEKKPGTSNHKRIVVFAYYINHILKKQEFSEGQIEYAYKALGISGRPSYLHQAMIDLKNKKAWLENGSGSDKWAIKRLGELFVEERLPGENEDG